MTRYHSEVEEACREIHPLPRFLIRRGWPLDEDPAHQHVAFSMRMAAALTWLFVLYALVTMPLLGPLFERRFCGDQAPCSPAHGTSESGL